MREFTAQMEQESIETINAMLKDAKEAYTGEWTPTHTSKMQAIHSHIIGLRAYTNKNYVVKDGKVVVE